MNLSKEQSAKLGKYFINADPFLWGVLKAKNKKGRLTELKQMGFLDIYSEGSNPIYSKINRDLLVELGITGILEKIVVPRIENRFSPETLRYFRDCWEQGQTPDLNYLVKYELYHKRNFFTVTTPEVYDNLSHEPPIAGYKDLAFIFVQIETQHNFVERWTVFAGLWFEEIEPLLR
jgi:hypothetical protein